MKKIIATIFLSSFVSFTQAQDKQRSDTLRIDLDKDTKKDIVIFDRENAVIIVKLSTLNFKPMLSEKLEFEPVSAGIKAKKESFEFSNNWMRSGYTCQFRYNPKVKKMQLIGMTRYEFGPANNDGSGESSVNLLTNSYIGSWHYWDDQKNRLVAIPPIKKRMVIAPTYISDFDKTFNEYMASCSNYYREAKKAILAKK